jgi:hypothetical protein
MRYAALKDLLITSYYLSEPGATVELRYEHVPGVWEASTPMTKDTRAMPPGTDVGLIKDNGRRCSTPLSSARG